MEAHHTLRAAIVASLVYAAVATPAHAGSLSVGKWSTEESCRFYVTEWEREVAVASGSSQSAGAAVLTRDGAAAARRSSSQSSAAYLREWGQELNEICTQNFPRIRSTLASAMASNGAFNPGDGVFTVEGSPISAMKAAPMAAPHRPRRTTTSS